MLLVGLGGGACTSSSAVGPEAVGAFPPATPIASAVAAPPTAAAVALAPVSASPPASTTPLLASGCGTGARAAFAAALTPAAAARLTAASGSLLDALDQADRTDGPGAPECADRAPQASALAWEVHELDARGSSHWVDPSVRSFRFGDRVLVRFATNMPGLVEANTVEAGGARRTLGTWAVTGLTVGRVPRAGSLSFALPEGEDAVTLTFTPCRFDSAPTAPAGAWRAEVLARLPDCHDIARRPPAHREPAGTVTSDRAGRTSVAMTEDPRVTLAPMQVPIRLTHRSGAS